MGQSATSPSIQLLDEGAEVIFSGVLRTPPTVSVTQGRDAAGTVTAPTEIVDTFEFPPRYDTVNTFSLRDMMGRVHSIAGVKKLPR
jgi:hypothetical protein